MAAVVATLFNAGFDASLTLGTFSRQSNVTNTTPVSHQRSEKNMNRDAIRKEKPRINSVYKNKR